MLSSPAHTPRFTLELETLREPLQVLSFEMHESLNSPFSLSLELVCSRPDLSLESLLHQPALLSVDGQPVHGLVTQAAQGESGKRLSFYRVLVQPRLAWLAHRIGQRIFQQLSVPQIIARVLEEHGILPGEGYRFELGPEPYPLREYCVQYAESDLHFVQRLCEEEGLHFHFVHSAQGHCLVFGDNDSVFAELSPLAYWQDSGMAAEQPVVRRFDLSLQTRTSRVSRRDYDFQQPFLSLQTQASAHEQVMPDLEDYAYPGRYTRGERGKLLSRRALERHRAGSAVAEGVSDSAALRCGALLSLTEHPRDEWNALWLLTGVVHTGYQPQVLEADAEWVGDRDARLQPGYHNTFMAIPRELPFRPALEHPKPRILGSQTAVVTGPAGEEIHCDEYGRVKVQFHWDREGQADEHSSCWLRVAQGWAGDRYGSLVIPRIGMEVLVTFLEGDPDQPLVTGCLYHKEHEVPYALPEHKTRTVFKSDSSVAGEGCNELRIEDRKGHEQVYVHAQRNWDENIEHDQLIRVGNQRHTIIEQNSYSEILGEEHRRIRADRRVQIQTEDHLDIAHSQHIRVGERYLHKAGQEIHLKAGQKLVIEADQELTLSAGGCFIKLDLGGVTLLGPQVKINAGGSPGQGSGIALKSPKPPYAADNDKAGNLLQTPQPEIERKEPLAVCEECLLKARQNAQGLVPRQS